MRKALARSGAAAGGILVAVLLTGAPASAHVTVSSANANQGGFAKLTFRVPNEKDTASTVKLEVQLPADKPLAFVSTKPVTGWTVQADKTKLAQPIKTDDGELTEAVTKLTWTASADAAIKPGQFQEFDVSVGPLPAVDKLTFKALQTYSDGDIVRWIEEPADGKEAEHPAPTLALAAKAPTGASAGTSSAPVTNAAATSTTDTDARSRANIGLGLGIAALAVAVLGTVLAGLAIRRRSTT